MRALRVQCLIVFIIGLLVAVALQVGVSRMFGDAAAMIQVGVESSVESLIKSELGPDIPTFPNMGHDGQSSYVIARHPFGGEGSDQLGSPAFRYRRWVYPALSGAFGVLGPRATLVGLALLASIGFGLAAAAMFVIMSVYGVRSPVPLLAVYLNPGLMLSVVLLTPDALGMGFSLAAVAAYLKRRPAWAVALMVLAVATKEQFILFGLAMAVDAWFRKRRTEAGCLAGLPVVGLAVLSLATTAAFGGSGSLGSNVGLPLAGLMEASAGWVREAPVVRSAAYFTLAGLVLLAPLALWSRDRLIVLMAAGWFAGGLLAGEVVWRKGTDIIRVEAAIWPLIALALAVSVVRSVDSRPTSSRLRSP